MKVKRVKPERKENLKILQNYKKTLNAVLDEYHEMTLEKGFCYMKEKKSDKLSATSRQERGGMGGLFQNKINFIIIS